MARKADHSKAQDMDFSPIAPGNYEVFISKAMVETTPKGTVVLKMRTIIRDDVTQDFQKRNVFYDVFVTDNTWDNIVQGFIKAIGVPDGTDFSEDNLEAANQLKEIALGKPVLAYVANEEYNGKTYDKVKSAKPSKVGGTLEIEREHPVNISDEDLPF